MHKIKFLLLTIISVLVLSSCLNSDDNKIDYDWKTYQEGIYDGIRDMVDENGKSIYYEVKSESGNGSVYCKESDFITKRMEGDFAQEEPIVYPKTKSIQAKPSAITDSVIVRYEGWYYNRAGEFTIFDSGTEGTANNTRQAGFKLSGVVDGFRTALMDMTINDERIVSVPTNMGYGSSGNSAIPGYTTLFFDIKLLKIYSGDGTLIAE